LTERDQCALALIDTLHGFAVVRQVGRMIRCLVTYREDLTRATLKVYERYAVEVVERFGFCPWARASRESESVVLNVIFSVNHDDFSESLAQLAALSGLSEDTDIALFIYPLLDLDRLPFEAFAMAAFHPAADVDLSDPDRLVPYVRRSPDPTLQLVRKSALSSIKGLTSGTAFLDVASLSLASLEALSAPAPKAVRERIGEQNLSTVRRVGPPTIDAVLDDIFREREAAHAALLERYGERGPRRYDPG
jgi:hypothetical protein